MFITNHPAMHIKNALAVADIHLGITRELWEAGVSMPQQAIPLAKRLNMLRKLTKTDMLLILGDLKHRIPRIPMQEFSEVEKFFMELKFRKVVVLKGNHDGNIEKMLDDKIKVKSSHTLGDFCFAHGHAIVNSKKILVIGHNHPHVRFKDKMGAVYIEPVWVRGITSENKKVIIMPAFNELAGSMLVNNKVFMGPIAKNIDPKKSHVFLLDGTDIGTISSLKAK